MSTPDNGDGQPLNVVAQPVNQDQPANGPSDAREPVPGSREPVPGTRTERDENVAQDGSQARTDEPPKEPKNWTHYAHLANGEVVKINKKMHDAIVGAGHTFRRDGVEHHVIGVYPKENEFTVPEEDDE